MTKARTRCSTARTALAGLIFVLTASCGDNTDVVSIIPSTTASQAESEQILSNDGDPVYLLYTTIDTPDSRTSYYVTSPSIDSDTRVEVTAGLEGPGEGVMYAPPEGGYVLIGSGEAPTFTRYELNEAGQLERGDTLSFANLGTESTEGHMRFLSNSKAYFFDRSQVQIISFDPSRMELINQIPLDDFDCDGEITGFGTPIVRGDGVYVPRTCWAPNASSSRGTSLAHVDTETDEVNITQESRCMGLELGFITDNGDAYWGSNAYASLAWTFMNLDTPHDCALRLKSGETEFDETWEMEVTQRTGGVSAIFSVPAGGSQVWVRAFEKAAFQGDIPLQEVAWDAKAWRWGLLDVESGGDVQLDESSDLVGFYGAPIFIDGTAYSPSSSFGDTVQTVLLKLTDSGIENGIVVDGELRNVVRLR